MKTIYKLVLKSYLGPMVLTFFIIMFVLMMNVLWRYIDELVGKGLDPGTIIELLCYATINMIPMALPLATLLAAIMTMGNLGENYELLAMKSAGMSLPKIMRPLLVVVSILAVGSFFIANNLVPYANKKFFRTIYDIRQMNQTLEFQDGLFFNGIDGIVVPGGFGNRGIEGKIAAAHYARTHNVPYLGICLGMQIAVIEFARSVCGLADANSGEFDESSTNKVIDFMPDQNDEIDKGGTLRLGAYPCCIVPGTKMAECYGTAEISERHRHRYEFNNNYRTLMQEKGLVLSGLSPDGHIVETIEIPENDFYIGVQYHPEFKSRPNKAHPLFKGLISAALRHTERG